MTTIVQDLRYALRMLLKAPVVSIVAALSLALGIAANASMFSILNAWFFEPLPYHDQDGLVIMREGRQGESIEMAAGASIPNFRDYVEASSTFESATAYTLENANLTGTDVPERLQVVVATPELFDVLGVPPAIGRGFRAEEGAEGLGNVLVLEHDFWERRFFADRDILGRTLTLDGTTYTIVGVTPPEFDMIPANVQAFRPTDFMDRMEQRAGRGYIAIARLRPGATLEQSQLELAGVSTRLAAEFPDANRGWELRMIRLRDFFPGPTDTKLMMILTAVTLFGLMIACANVANLLLGRAELRQREVAVRTALGAGRTRILRQLLTESVTLGTIAGAVGVVLSIWVVRWIQSAMPAEMPRAMMPTLAPEVVVASLLVAVVAGVLFGLAPALTAARADLRETLGGGARGGTAGRRRKRLRNAFVIGEFAVALSLLTGAGFLVNVFSALNSADPGFNPEGLLTFQLSVLDDRYAEDTEVMAYETELIRVLGTVPGVQDVAVMASLPRGRGNPMTRYTVDGSPTPEPTEQPQASFQIVNPAYFSTMEIALRQGRLIQESDREDAQKVAVVSQALVDREFPEEDPLGKTLTVSDESRVIVGVVEDIMQERIAIAGRQGEAIYLPYSQHPVRNPSFALRTNADDPASLAGDVRQAIWSVEPDQPIALLRTFEAHQRESLAGPEAISSFLMVIGGIALLLAAMGIYGVMNHAVAQQRREIGIRMALGAPQKSVVGMVTRSGLTLAGAGMVIGLPLAWLMYRGVQNALNLFEGDFGFGMAGWVALALGGAALVSVLLPAAKASGVEPVMALRED
jgi:putative ABC transport system permease protein